MTEQHAPASLLIFAIGNPSRGDDALGPALLEGLQTELTNHPELELLSDFQLQVEHALDLQGRQAVLFVDAALPGVCPPGQGGVLLTAIHPDQHLPPLSHALRPQALLTVAQRVLPQLPPAWLLAIEGQSFELGEPLSEAAKTRLSRALNLARSWLKIHRDTEQWQLNAHIEAENSAREKEETSSGTPAADR